MHDLELRRWWWAAVAAMVLCLAAPAARAQPEPAWKGGGNEPVTLDLMTKVGTMGSEPTPVYDGEVRVGSWDLERLGPRDKGPYVHYLARIPVVFAHEETDRLVRQVKLSFQLAGNQSHVRALFPAQVRERTAELTTFVSGDFRFTSEGGPAAIRQLKVPVEPLVDGLGAGAARCGWQFAAEGSGRIHRGDRTVFLILSVPPREHRLEIEVQAQIEVGRELLGIHYDNVSEVSRQTFAIDLPEAPDPVPEETCGMRLSAARLAGAWSSDFGIVSLEQQGAAVTGTYSCCQGTLAGKRRGSRLALTWKDAISGQGWVDFELAACGDELRGVWGKDAPQGVERKPLGKWNAARQPPEERPPGLASFWRVEGMALATGTLHGTAALYEGGGKQVQGKIDAQFTITFQGQNQFTPVVNRLAGKWNGAELALDWRNPLDGSAGQMNLRKVAGRLQGSWSTADGRSRGEIVFHPATPGEGAQAAPCPPSAAEQADSLARGARGRALVDEAEALRRQPGKAEKAAKLFRQAIALLDRERDQQRLALAYYGLGLSERQLGRQDAADRAFHSVLALEETDPAMRLLAEAGLQ